MKGKILVAIALLLLSLVLPVGAAATDSDRREPVVRFEGVVASRPTDKIGDWVISGQSVNVVKSTQFIEAKGLAEVGAKVVVLARRLDNGQLQAMLIRVTEPAVAVVKIKGFVTEFGDTYLIVNGLRITITDETEIKGQLAVGTFVKVEALVTSSGYEATNIEVLPVVRPKIVEFEGELTSKADTQWTVDDRQITVNEQTMIVGTPDVGDWVKVRALVQSDSTLLALLIVVREKPKVEEWTGTIEKLPPNIAIYPPRWIGPWVVEGRTVWVTSRTEIVGTPQVNKTATVKALRYAHRPLVAIRIEILEPTETPIPTETPTSAATP